MWPNKRFAYMSYRCKHTTHAQIPSYFRFSFRNMNMRALRTLCSSVAKLYGRYRHNSMEINGRRVFNIRTFRFYSFCVRFICLLSIHISAVLDSFMPTCRLFCLRLCCLLGMCVCVRVCKHVNFLLLVGYCIYCPHHLVKYAVQYN